MDKQDKKALKKAFKEAELKAFRETLPMNEMDFLPLFDYLDNALSANECKNDFTLLESYCKQERYDFQILAKWFKGQGGYCDCEVLGNVEEKFAYLTKPVPIIQPKQTQTIQRQKLDTLTTDFGFSIKKVPAPWILSAITQNDKTIYQFQIGKKPDFPAMLESDFPVEKLSDDKFLHDYWVEKTITKIGWLDSELEFAIESRRAELQRAELTIHRQIIQNFEIVQVQDKRLVSVFIFAYKQGTKWCLVLRTGTQRLRNDMKELEKLLREV